MTFGNDDPNSALKIVMQFEFFQYVNVSTSVAGESDVSFLAPAYVRDTARSCHILYQESIA